MSADSYLQAVFVEHLLEGNFISNAGGRWILEERFVESFLQDFKQCFSNYGYIVNDESCNVAAALIGDLIAREVILHEGDRYSGKFLKLVPESFSIWAKAYRKHDEFAERLRRLGEDAVAQSLTTISRERFWNLRTPWQEMDLDARDLMGEVENYAPAADRIVFLNDNQIGEIDAAAEDVSSLLKKENSIDGDADERSRILAQIDAARVLIRAGSVRAYLLYETLFHALGLMIEKYRDKVLGQVASKLLDLIITHILGGGK